MAGVAKQGQHLVGESYEFHPLLWVIPTFKLKIRSMLKKSQIELICLDKRERAVESLPNLDLSQHWAIFTSPHFMLILLIHYQLLKSP